MSQPACEANNHQKSSNISQQTMVIDRQIQNEGIIATSCPPSLPLSLSIMWGKETKHPGPSYTHAFLSTFSSEFSKEAARRPTCQLATHPLKQAPSHSRLQKICYWMSLHRRRGSPGL